MSRYVTEVMKKEDTADWAVLRDFLKDQYTVLKVGLYKPNPVVTHSA